MLKAAIKHGSDKDKIRHRIVPQDAVNKWAEKLESLKEEISEILREEKEEKQVHISATDSPELIFTKRPKIAASTSGNGAEERSKHH